MPPRPVKNVSPGPRAREYCPPCDDTGYVELKDGRGATACGWCELGHQHHARRPQLPWPYRAQEVDMSHVVVDHTTTPDMRRVIKQAQQQFTEQHQLPGITGEEIAVERARSKHFEHGT